MEKSFLLRSSLFGILILLFFFPIIHILFYVPLEVVAWDTTLIEVIKGASLQSFISTVLTLVISLVGAFGFINFSQRLSEKQKSVASILIMLPSFLPPLVIVILGTQATGTYLTGLWGIVYFHVFMNVGFVGLILAHYLQKNGESWAQLCRVEGVGGFRFVFRGLLPGIKNELKLIFGFLFILYFLSFSIPLLVGDIRYSGLEVFIYEKIFLYGNWNEAVQYSVGFIVFLFLMTFVTNKKSLSQKTSSYQLYGLLGYTPLWLVGLLFLPLLLLGYGFLMSMSQAQQILTQFDGSQARGTILLGLLTGSFVFIILSLMGYVFVREQTAKRFFTLISPSWAVVGFSFFLLGSNASGWGFIKVATALAILYIPYLFRLSYFSSLRELQSQVDVALISGASWNKIYFVIIWPQVLPMICFLSGLGALWACGDFALSGMLLGDDMTLALQMKSLFTNYRLEQALVLLVPLVVLSVIIFLIFQGLSYVCRRSFLS